MINLLPGIQSTSSALTAERIRMEVVSQNIANSRVEDAGDGKPYQRQVVTFESLLGGQMGTGAGLDGVQVAKIMPDNRPAKRVPSPGNPKAGADGCVDLPNISVHEEMVDLITASRAFEANLAVVKASRNMTMQTLSIGKRA
jgi:flagellar basal-body rod protein FlgC